MLTRSQDARERHPVDTAWLAMKLVAGVLVVTVGSALIHSVAVCHSGRTHHLVQCVSGLTTLHIGGDILMVIGPHPLIATVMACAVLAATAIALIAILFLLLRKHLTHR